MRRFLPYIVAGILFCGVSAAAERKSWSKIRYVGGTVAIKTGQYDWNTTLTVSTNPASIVVSIAPAKMFAPSQTVSIKASQVVSLSDGPGAWRRVEEVPGAVLPPKPPTLFGLFDNHFYMGIVYRADDGKPGAILLDTLFLWKILPALKSVTGRPIEDSP